MGRLVFGEDDGEMLDSVGSTELFEEPDEFTEFVDKPVIILVSADVSEQDHVVGEMGGSVRGCQYYERHR